MKYNRTDINDFAAICGIIGDKSRILWKDQINEDYSHDELGSVHSMPDIVIKAKTTEEISGIMNYADKRCIPVTPRGSGTGLVGAAVPLENGIVIDMSGMNRIIELDEENLTVTLEPGVLLMQLAEYAEAHGFLYPPDPGEKTATIGGNISTNAGGMRAVKYGVTRDYVRALEVVLPDGEIINIGGKIVKNSSGYALKDLMIGSEGTLGIITKATLKLIPLPQKTISLLIPFNDLGKAIDTVPIIIKSKAIPTAVEFMLKSVIENAESYLGSVFPDKSSDAYLLLRFDGNSKEEIEKAYESVAHICLEQGAPDVFILDTDERNEIVWKARGAFLEAIKMSTSEMDECDVVVPRSKVNEMVMYADKLGYKTGLRIRYFGHVGDGNLHVYMLRDGLDRDTWKEKLGLAMDELYRKARELNGAVSGEHGIGYAKKEYLAKSLDKRQILLMKSIKDVFDPKGILNPGKIY